MLLPPLAGEGRDGGAAFCGTIPAKSRALTQPSPVNGRGLLPCSFPRLRGKAGMGVGVAEVPQDHVADAFEVLENIIIPEPHYGESLAAQERIAMGVGLRPVVLAAIDFYQQLLLQTGEVDDVRADRMLTSKSASHELPATQALPQLLLGIGHVAPELAREIPILSVAHPCAS